MSCENEILKTIECNVYDEIPKMSLLITDGHSLHDKYFKRWKPIFCNKNAGYYTEFNIFMEEQLNNN